MPWSNGDFQLVTDLSRDRDLGPPDSLIDADKLDNEFANIAEGLELCILRDGTTTPTSAIPFGNQRLTGLGAATANTDAVRADQVARDAPGWAGTFGGTANALAATLALMPGTLVAGCRVTGVVSADNTGAATLTIGGATLAIKRLDNSDLQKGDLRTGRVIQLRHNGTAWVLTTPLSADGYGQPVYVLSGSASATPETPDVHVATAPAGEFSELRAGQLFIYTSHRINTDYLHLSINGSSSVGVLDYRGQDLSGGEVLNNATYLLYYNGTNFRIVGGLGGGGGGGGATTLVSLTDVDTGLSPTDGDVLSYDNGIFVLRTLPENIATAEDLVAKADASAVTTALAAKLDASSVSTFGASLIDDADNTTARATLGLGTMATEAKTTWDAYISNINTALGTKLNTSAAGTTGLAVLGAATQGAGRTALGLGDMSTQAISTWNGYLAAKLDASAVSAFGGSLVAAADAAAAQSLLEFSSASVGKWDGAAKTVSASAPSGGEDGDIWFEIEA